MGDIEYIQPNQIGCTVLSKEERITILKYERKYIKKILRTVFFSAAFIFCIYQTISGFDIENIKTAIMLFLAAWVNICTINSLKYTASAYGTVVKKDIIMQRVIAGRTYRYRRFFPETPYTNKPTSEQEFYYLTLQLNSGKYVRYVNCLREDFISVSKGDTVLAVCFGFNEIKGYLI